MRSLLLCVLLTLPLFAQTPAPAPAPAKATPAPGRPAAIADTQLFQVVLLRASRAGGDDTEGLPAAAMKALEDLREFLPFRHYRLLDSQLVRAAQGHTGHVALEPYEVRLAYERKGETLDITSFIVWPEQATPKPPSPGDANLIAPKAMRPLISTSFQMNRGETIVVGSSRIAGNEALIVLLTAVKSK
jgi:hypothetical protein